MMNRAYSVFELKSFDDGQGIITGVATTPAADRVGDVVEPKGAKFALPLPLLWQHNAASPIGHVTQAKVTDSGIEVVARIARGVTDEIDHVWKLIKGGLVRGLSVGFRSAPGDREFLKGGGVRFKSWEWIELSAVTIPANTQASIQSIKAFDLGAPIGADVVRIAPLARDSAAYSIPLQFPKE